MKQKILCWIFSKVYKKWLWNDFFETYDRVLKVKGWRTALVCSVGKTGREVTRRTMTPIFWWFE